MPPLSLPDPELADDVIRLRPPSLEDVPALTAGCRDPLVQRFTFVPSPYEEAHARGWVEASPETRAAGEALSFVIVGAQDGALLGTAGLLRPDWAHGTAELGYWVGPWARRRGAATRAVRLLAPWALRTLGLARVTLEVDVENVASQGVAERAGFTREGVLRSAIEAKGRRWSLAVYSLLAEEVAAR
jgi:RimJ/RimL family protein N-acetyltransferase